MTNLTREDIVRDLEVQGLLTTFSAINGETFIRIHSGTGKQLFTTDSDAEANAFGCGYRQGCEDTVDRTVNSCIGVKFG